MVINYNKWFSDQPYRKSISKSLGLPFYDGGINKVLKFGGGSSFDGLDFDGRAGEMKVLDRWKNFTEDEQYWSLLSDKKVSELSNDLFEFSAKSLIKKEEIKMESKLERQCESVTAVIVTKDRYFSTLPMAISSVINQKLKPDRLVIVDDGEHKDLREIPIYKYLFYMMTRVGIDWEVLFGARAGPVWAHHTSLLNCTTDWIWRLDDDEIADFDVLEKLISKANKDTGAIASLVLDPMSTDTLGDTIPLNKIDTINTSPNIQWLRQDDKLKEVDHLYSSFLYRREASRHGYCLDLSKASHREETIFTHEMKRRGWKLLVDPTSTTWHLRNPEGGIRSHNDHSLWQHDQEIFNNYISEWKQFPIGEKLVILDCGLGDHICFRMILPELEKKYSKITIAACYPKVFRDDNAKLISISEAKNLLGGNADRFNIYKFMAQRSWKRQITEAYRDMYV